MDDVALRGKCVVRNNRDVVKEEDIQSCKEARKTYHVRVK